jgi:hypothetical protein
MDNYVFQGGLIRILYGPFYPALGANYLDYRVIAQTFIGAVTRALFIRLHVHSHGVDVDAATAFDIFAIS